MAVVETLSTRPVGLAGHDQGQGDGDGEGDDLADEDQFDGHRRTGGQDVGHRLVVEVGGAEVAVEGGVQPDHVLVPQRQVEAQLLEQDGPVGGRVVGPEDGSVGSPGSRWTSRNTSTEMTNDTTTSWRNRLMRYLPIKSAQTGLSIP